MKTNIKTIFELSNYSNNTKKEDILAIPEDKLLKILLENQVLLPVLENLKKINDPQFISIQNKIEKILSEDYLVGGEEKFLWTMDFLEQLKVEYLFHKYPFYKREQSDIDVLIPPEKENMVINELHNLGFSEISKEDFKTAMSKIQNNSKFTIHVHSKIKWESEFIDTDDVWSRSRQINVKEHTIRIPSPEDLLLIEAAHTIFENRAIRICDLLQFSAIIKENIDWDVIVSRFFKYKYPEAGFLYFYSINQLGNLFYGHTLIKSDVLNSLKHKTGFIEKSLVLNPILKISKDVPTKVPIRMKLSSSVFLFLLYNSRFGMRRFFWASKIILISAFKRIKF